MALLLAPALANHTGVSESCSKLSAKTSLDTRNDCTAMHQDQDATVLSHIWNTKS